MADATLVKSVEALLSEKQAVVQREKELVESLNRVLNQMGYAVVARRDGQPAGIPRRRRRRRGRRGPGRPKGSKNRPKVGRPAKAAKTGRRGPGRPPKNA